MARRTLDSRPTVRSEGGLLPPELLDRITDPRERDLPGLDPSRDYGLESNVRVTEAAARSWEHAKAYWGAFKARLEGSRPGAELGVTRQQWLLPLLAELGYDDLDYRQQAEEVNGRPFHISHRATSEDAAPPLHLVAASQPLDKADPSAPGPKASPHGFLQSYLNETDHVWGIVSNGRQLRILRDNASLTRPAYLEFDLKGMMEGGVFSDFTLLWLVAHRTRLPKGTTDATSCLLEKWSEAAQVRGSRVQKELRGRVRLAINALGQGFLDHPENEQLRARLADGGLTAPDYHRQILRMVYRMLFLLVAEERDLLFPDGAPARGRAIYAENYSLSRLREHVRQVRGDQRHDDIWRAQLVAFDLLRAGNASLGLPALGGGIFDPRMCPDLDGAQLRNDAVKDAIRGLSLAPTKSGYRRINYRDLDVEELGGVYEGLLEEQPSLGVEVGRTRFELDRSGDRKATGSYYTPPVLVQELIRSALDPVIQQALASAPDIDGKRRALLDLAVCDPACGSGHFLLAAARRIGEELARLASGEYEPDLRVRRHHIREAITHCVYGVDLNPLAVDLCRLALWLEGHEPGRPLGFLDHRIKLGNSLVGATTELIEKGIPTDAFKPVEGDNPGVATAIRQQNRQELERPQLRLFESTGLEPAGPTAAEAKEARTIADFEEDAPDDVLLKEEEHAEFEARLAHRKRAADLWVAAFFWPLQVEAPSPPTQSTLLHHRAGRTQEMGAAFDRQLLRVLDEVRPFHWELEYPDVFARKGGFDCMLGNPPWDTLSPDRREFFRTWVDGLRSMAPIEQDAEIDRLLTDQVIEARWAAHCRGLLTLVHFLKQSGVFTLYAPGNLGKGDFNVYRMFVEVALRRSRVGGVVGMVVPGGLYGGANASAIRKHLLDRCQLLRLYGLINTQRGWFEEVDIDRFAAFTAMCGGRTDGFAVQFGLASPDDLSKPSVEMSAELIRQRGPETYAIPDIRDIGQLETSTKMHRACPAFAAPGLGPPTRHYSRELDMGNDRARFTTDPVGLPVYEGRMIDHFDHRAKTYVSGHGNSSVWIEREFGDPNKAIRPQWRVLRNDLPAKLGDRCDRYRIGFGDVANPRNERSLVACIVPPGSVCGDKVPTLDFGNDEWFYLPWLAVANSFAMDWLARTKLTSPKMAFSLLDSLPFPHPARTDAFVETVASAVLRLICTAPEMTAFWNQMAKLGFVDDVDSGTVPHDALVAPERRELMRAELDAIVASSVFGLTRTELSDVMDSFGVLQRRDEKTYGEFRTKRMILEAFDQRC